MTLYTFCQTYKPSLLCLAEPMVDFPSNSEPLLAFYTYGAGCRQFQGGFVPSIWVFHSLNTNNFDVFITREQFITIGVQKNTHRVSFVYASVFQCRNRLL